MANTNMLMLDTELVKYFGFWSSILIIKWLAMPLLTVRYRFQKGIFMNQDDCKYTKGSKVATDADVERVRRAHLNDLENLPIWFICTLLWLTTGPNVWLAKVLIKVFVLVRIGHTFSYAIYPKQPFRAIFFVIGLVITIFQSFNTLMYYL